MGYASALAKHVRNTMPKNHYHVLEYSGCFLYVYDVYADTEELAISLVMGGQIECCAIEKTCSPHSDDCLDSDNPEYTAELIQK